MTLSSPTDTFIYGVGACTSKTGNYERLICRAPSAAWQARRAMVPGTGRA